MTTYIIISLIALIPLTTVIAFHYGKEKGQKEAAAFVSQQIANSINYLHYYFVGYPMIFNTLFLIWHRLSKGRTHFLPDRLRSAVLGAGDDRYCDMNKDELDLMVVESNGEL